MLIYSLQIKKKETQGSVEIEQNDQSGNLSHLIVGVNWKAGGRTTANLPITNKPEESTEQR